MRKYIKMISLKIENITVNIVECNSQDTAERDFELLVDYVSVLQEIYNDTKLHETVAVCN